MESRLQVLLSEEEAERLAKIQEKNARFTGKQLVTYDLLTSTISCVEWFAPLSDPRITLATGPITESFEESTWPGYSTLEFFCDFGEVPITPGRGVDRYFSVTVTTDNIYELEKYLRWRKDHSSARNLRRLFPEVDFDPPPLFERLGKRLSLIP